MKLEWLQVSLRDGCPPTEADLKSSGFSFDADAAMSSMENIGVFRFGPSPVSGG